MEKAWREQTKEVLQPLPPLKEFKPKMGLPILENYRKKPLATFWNTCQRKHLSRHYQARAGCVAGNLSLWHWNTSTLTGGD